MATDKYGYPMIQGDQPSQEVVLASWEIPQAEPLTTIKEDLQTLANALAVKDAMSPIEPSLARMMMLMGT